MANFFRTLDGLHGGGGLPSWASTHPDPGERYTTVRGLTQQWQAQVPAGTFRTDRNGFVARLEGLVFGPNPRQGYVDAGAFLHPDLRFRFPVPGGWQVQNSASQVVLAPEDGSAAVFFTLDGKHSDPLESARAFATSGEVQTLSTTNITIGGLPAVRLISSSQSRSGELGVLSTFIGYQGRVYVFHGVTGADGFARARSTFAAVADGFGPLTDPAALAIQPVVVHVVEAPRTASFQNLVAPYPIPERAEIDLGGLALINGFELGEQVQRGTLLKVLRVGMPKGV
jgi:predicted Zn-dependent protease